LEGAADAAGVVDGEVLHAGAERVDIDVERVAHVLGVRAGREDGDERGGGDEAVGRFDLHQAFGFGVVGRVATERVDRLVHDRGSSLAVGEVHVDPDCALRRVTETHDPFKRRYRQGPGGQVVTEGVEWLHQEV